MLTSGHNKNIFVVIKRNFMKSLKNKLAAIVMTGSVLAGFILPLQVHAHGADSVVKTSDGTIWFITDNDGTLIRRAFTSDGAFRSYGFLSYNNVAVVDGQDLNYTRGGFIPPRDGAIFCATETKGSDVKGECSLITEGKKAAFTSASVFSGLGFTFARAFYGDSSFLSKTSNIDSATEAHRSGVLINDNGTVKVAGPVNDAGIPSVDVFNSWGWNFADVVPANAADRALTQAGIVSGREPGQISLYDNSGVLYQLQKFYDAVDAYPAFPTNVVTSPADSQAVNTLINQLNNTATFEQSQIYFSASTAQIFSEMPMLLQLFNDYESALQNVVESGGQVIIYGTPNFALYTYTASQPTSGYSYPSALAFVKENGVWKFDFLGTTRWGVNYDKSINPNDKTITGSGNTDLKIVNASFSDPRISSQNDKLVIRLKNTGQTTIHKFYVVGYYDYDTALGQDLTYSLLPGQEIILSIPMNYFEYGDAPGLYPIDVTAGVDGVIDPTPQDSVNFRINQNFTY